MFPNVEMQDPAPTVFGDEKAIQDPEGPRRHRETIHGPDHIAVIAKKGCPYLAGLVTRRQAPQIARNSTFRDLEAKL